MPIAYDQCVGRSSSRVKGQPTKHIKEFQNNFFILKKTTRKNTQINHKREKEPWKMFTA